VARTAQAEALLALLQAKGVALADLRLLAGLPHALQLTWLGELGVGAAAKLRVLHLAQAAAAAAAAAE
jgi:hypothetical protein